MKIRLISVTIILLAFTSCHKENTDQIIVQEKFTAPSIELAKQYVNTYIPKNAFDLAFRDASESVSSVTDWQNSKTEKYKVTEELDVDILYTPIYVDSPRTDIKAFIASIDLDGIIDSRKIYVLYRSNDLSNGLNAYILIFGLDGEMLLAYNYVNGQSVPLPESDNNGDTYNRDSSDCGIDFTGMNANELEIWWYYCYNIMLDEVVLYTTLAPDGPANGSTSEFNDWNNQWVTVNIDPEPGQSSNYNTGDAVPINISWHTPNYAFANAASIAKVIKAEYISLEANWLRQMEQSNPTLLNIIADFLNASRVRNQNSEYNFDYIQPEQFPISDEAKQYITSLINIGINNSNLEDIENLLADALNNLMSFTPSEYPGINDGLPFNWWNDEVYIQDLFNQDPYDIWRSISQEEKNLIKTFPREAYQIYKNRSIAEDETFARFGFNRRNDKSDAFRHAYFNVINSKRVGTHYAKLFSDAHESEVPFILNLEVQMDIFNNTIGQQSIIGSGLLTDSQLANLIYQRLLNGDLRYLSPLNPVIPPLFGINASTVLTPTNL